MHINVILLYATNNRTNPVDFVKFSLTRVTVRDCNPTTNPITGEAPSVGSLRQFFSEFAVTLVSIKPSPSATHACARGKALA